ncbi:uncharacterized protein LOC110627656 isoform X2 [Manihot esculenta]|nr:uncharacterized protein LOC110627656 isoform X2 [Manihot esculenta]
MRESEDAHQQARGNSHYKNVNSHVNFPSQSNRKSSLLYRFFPFTISISSSTISFFFFFFSGKKDPMFEFGDEFTIESYRIPWLIWIQIIILFLLIFLFFSFSVFTSDPSQSHYNTKTPSSATSPSPSSLASVSAVSNSNKPLLNHSTTTTVANRLQHNQQKVIGIWSRFFHWIGGMVSTMCSLFRAKF